MFSDFTKIFKIMSSCKYQLDLALGIFILASVLNLAGNFVGCTILSICSKPFIVPSLAVLCWFLLKREGISGSRAATLVSALAFGAAGDILLMFDGQATFLAGLAAFLMGHVFYLVTIGVPHDVPSDHHFALRVIVPVALIFIMAMTAQLFKVKGLLGMAVTLYAVAFAFCINAGIHNAVFNRQRLYWITVIGYVLFVVSDTILATGKFTGIKIPASGFFVMLTYILAQFLIAVSLTLVEIRRGKEIKGRLD